MSGGRNALGPRGFLTDEEKQNMPRVTKGLLLRIFSYLKPYWVLFLFVFIAILLSATVGLAPSIITGKIVDRALVGKNMALLIRLLLMSFGTVAIGQIIGILENYINSWISQRIIFGITPCAPFPPARVSPRSSANCPATPASRTNISSDSITTTNLSPSWI